MGFGVSGPASFGAGGLTEAAAELRLEISAHRRTPPSSSRLLYPPALRERKCHYGHMLQFSK